MVRAPTPTLKRTGSIASSNPLLHGPPTDSDLFFSQTGDKLGALRAFGRLPRPHLINLAHKNPFLVPARVPVRSQTPTFMLAQSGRDSSLELTLKQLAGRELCLHRVPGLRPFNVEETFTVRDVMDIYHARSMPVHPSAAIKQGRRPRDQLRHPRSDAPRRLASPVSTI